MKQQFVVVIFKFKTPVIDMVEPFITFESVVLIFNFIVVGAAVGHDMRQAGT
jgi:hypothetical protein